MKKETGKSAQEYIQEKVIDVAKEKVLDSVNRLARLLMRLDLNILHILPVSLNGMLAVAQTNIEVCRINFCVAQPQLILTKPALVGKFFVEVAKSGSTFCRSPPQTLKALIFKAFNVYECLHECGAAGVNAPFSLSTTSKCAIIPAS